MFRWVSTLSMFELTISSWESVRPCGHIHPGGLKTTRQYLHPFNKPRKKAEIKKAPVFTRENQSKNPWGLNCSEGCLPETNCKKPPANEVEGNDRLPNHQCSEQFCWFQGGYPKPRKSQNQTRTKYGIRFQSPHWSSRFFSRKKNSTMLAANASPLPPLTQPSSPWQFWKMLLTSGTEKRHFNHFVSKWIDLQSRLSRDGFVVQIGCVLWSEFFFHQNPGSPSTQLPLVVIVGESYPIVGEWVGIVGDPPTGPFYLLPIDWMYRYKYSTWTWTWTLTLTCMYIHI